MMQAPSSQSKALPFPVTIFGSFAVLLRIVSVLFVSVALICISPVVRAEDPQPARGLGHVDIGYTAPLVHHGISLYGPDDPLPEKFDLRDISGKSYVSSVKDQGYYGTCWAFAALASAESNLLMRGYEQYTDLSELHLVNYTYHRTESLAELLGGTRGDVTTAPASIPYPNALTLGGNAMFAANTLSMRLGAADESILPYPPLDTDHSNPEPHVKKIILGTLEDDYARSKNILQFDHAYFISISEPDEIKKTLMTHGAASVSLYFDSATPDDLVYYYQNTDLVSNHDITIVGWDDTLPASSFSTEPPIDGAWICKNSWSSDWHDDGYFYVSYAEPSLGDAVFFSMNPIPGSSDVLYQYDGGLFPSGSSGEPGGSLSFANVFTAESDETLHSICLSNLVNTNTDVRIEIYTDLPDAYASPVAGKLQTASVTKQTLRYAGIYTLDLQTPVQLSAGENFSVVVTLSVPDGQVPYGDGDISGGIDGWFSSQAEAWPRESYMFIDNAWLDLGSKIPGGTARIKAITTRADSIRSIPQTGDSAHLSLWYACLIFSIAGMLACTIHRRRRRRR